MFHFLLRSSWRLLLGIDFLLFTILMWLLAWIPGLAGSRFYFFLFRRWCRSFVRALGVDLRLHQHYCGRLPDRYILIANHPSALEDIGIPALFPVHSLAKAEVARWWVVGRISRAAGTLYVRREDKASRRQAVEDMVAAVSRGRCIALYPEGGCRGRRIHDFRQGAFEVSLRTGVPVLPVFLHYEMQETFEWQDQPLLVKIRQFLTAQNPRANYHVYDPVEPAGFADKAEFASAMHARYLEWQVRYLD